MVLDNREKYRALLVAFCICFLGCRDALETDKIEDVSLEEVVDYSDVDTSDVVVRGESGDSYCSKYRGKKCSVQGPSDAVPCKCSGFSCKNWDASECSKCGHKAVKHIK